MKIDPLLDQIVADFIDYDLNSAEREAFLELLTEDAQVRGYVQAVIRGRRLLRQLREVQFPKPTSSVVAEIASRRQGSSSCECEESLV